MKLSMWVRSNRVGYGAVLALQVVVGMFGASCGDASSGDGGGAGGGAGSDAPAATFSEIFDMMYPMATNARCIACHGQPPNDIANGNLQMGADKDTAYEALVDKKSTSSRCGSATYVVPGDPDGSLLLQKMQDPAPCGSRMPLGGNQFTEEQLAMVRSWIMAGAKND